MVNVDGQNVLNDQNVDNPIRAITDGAFLELYFQERIRQDPGLSDQQLMDEVNGPIRRLSLYRSWFVRNRFKRLIRMHPDELRQLICIEWKYCEKRRALEQHEPALEVAFHVVLHAAFDISFFPYFLAWLLATGALDEFCGCEKKRFDSVRWLLERLRAIWPTPEKIRQEIGA